MKKIFTLAAVVLASVSMWAAYQPAADEVIYLQKDAYDASATEAGFSKHAAIAWEGTVSFSDKKAGDPENEGEATANNVKTCSVKGNGNGKNLWINVTNCAGIVVYHEKQSSRFVEFRDGGKTGDLLGTSAASTLFTEVALDPSKEYAIFVHGIKSDGGDQDFYVYAVKLLAGAIDHSKATVASIAIDDKKLAEFAPDKLEYNIVLDYGTTDVPEVSAVAGDEAKLEITQAAALPGDATVKCTSFDGEASVTYTIHFTVDANPSDDATLKSLKVDGAALAGFAADKYEYNVDLEFDAVAVPEVTAEVNEAHAKAVVNAAETLPGATTVVVTAQDGVTVLTYTINFAKEAETPIIRATHKKGKEAIVKGSIGGTSEKETQDNSKFGADKHFWGITLAGDATFQAGDSLVLDITEAPQGGTVRFFTDKTGAELIYDTEVLGEAGKNSFILPEAVNGHQSLYLVRSDATNKWNPFLKSISVYRKSGEVPSAIINTNAEVKVVKRIIDGQLVIEKNGVLYNAQGTIVR